MAKRVAVQVQVWAKRWVSPYDGLMEGKLEVFPLRDGSRLYSTTRYPGKGRNALEERNRKHARKYHKPETWTEGSEAVRARLAVLAKEGWTCTTRTARVPADEAPRGKSDGEVAREQYDREMRSYLSRGSG